MSEDLERWDEEVDDLLAGRGGRGDDATVLWLATATRPTPSGDLTDRIEASVGAHAQDVSTRVRTERPGRWVALVAALLAVAFVAQGLGNLFAGEWIAANLGEHHAPHVSTEGGLALLALAVCAAAAVVSRAWSGVSALTCAPLAISFGIGGIGEIGVFVGGVVLHLTEGVLGVLLITAWWWDHRKNRRDSPVAITEEGA